MNRASPSPNARSLPELAAVAGVAAASAALSVGLELLWRADLRAVVTWGQQFPVEALANAGVAVLVGLLFLGLTGRWLASLAMTAALFGLMGLVHGTKVALLGKPLFPWDVLLFREGFSLVRQVAGVGWAALLISCVLLGAALVRWRTRPLSWATRLGLLLGVALLVVWTGPRPSQRLSTLGVRNIHWVQSDNYRANGLLLAFAFNVSNAAVHKPGGYGAQAVRAVVDSHAGAPAAARSTLSPTVVVVMSESFFDPTRLPNVRFNQDPVPNLHRLQKEASSGELFPPVFGGGTANTEFEFLTGHSMHFLPAGSVPYQQYVRRKHPSLATIYAAQGYRTAALHTHFRWFWEREQVYRHFGFQRFTSSEDMPGAAVDGKYISDAVLTEHIEQEFEASPQPLFLFAVSMEAHGPYEPGRYPLSSLRPEGSLDEAARAELTTYAEAAHHADRELGALIAYFSTVQRPVFVVFFGDHQPSLPLSLRQTGVAPSLQDLSREQKQFLHQTPLIIWTNTGLPRRDLGALSSSFLGPLLLELTDMPGTRYTEFLKGVRNKMPVVMQGLVSDANGALHDEPPDELRALDDDWWTLEYDLLFGEDYQSEEPEEPDLAEG